MKEYSSIAGIKAYYAKTVVLGSGAAALNAAALLKKGGEDDLLIVTEAFKAGTSRNTGSDKQTYYKLSLAGSDSDSVRELAQDLFNGRCVDGDIALVEAALSTPSFLRLSSLGVPFPTNRYGEYIGYKTDHDPHRRATSAGPYTSRFMTECLEKEVRSLGIEIADGLMAVKILVRDEEVRGIAAIDRKTGELCVILCHSLVFATGGPAGIYSSSVFPESQFGSTGIAFEAGCMGKNLTEWQYGLSSVKPRWNVSGSYMQVLPRFVSVDEDGTEHEFLFDYIYSVPEMLSRVFLKGYQWPFDVRKLEKGSSIVDVLCFLEGEKGRKVYLDFMHNPLFASIPWNDLSDEARSYLQSAGATGDTPIERLKAMNLPAYNFYLDKGVDLEKEYLEIALSAQHNNGGLSISAWWESNIKGVFPVGEAAASHGVYRPGGSALNAGQCGSRRAAEWILHHRQDGWTPTAEDLEESMLEVKQIIDNALTGDMDAESIYEEAKKDMTRCGSVIRNSDDIKALISKVDILLGSFSSIKVKSNGRIWYLFELRNALLEQKVYLEAMLNYVTESGLSRGSSLYSSPNGKVHPVGLDSRFIYSLEDEADTPLIQEVSYDRKGDVSFSWREARPIPSDDDFFENVWAGYRKCNNVY